MIITVTKWENRLGFCIPEDLLKEINLVEGTEVDLRVVEGNLVIKPTNSKRYSLDELVAQITPDNLHSEVDSGIALGNESW